MSSDGSMSSTGEVVMVDPQGREYTRLEFIGAGREWSRVFWRWWQAREVHGISPEAVAAFNEWGDGEFGMLVPASQEVRTERLVVGRMDYAEWCRRRTA